MLLVIDYICERENNNNNYEPPGIRKLHFKRKENLERDKV